MRRCILPFFLFSIPCLAQTLTAPIPVSEAALRAGASVYKIPAYPPESIQAKHAGRVVVEVIVEPALKDSALSRIKSTRVVETPDQAMASAVLESLKEARYLPLFDEEDKVAAASGQVIFEFRLEGGRAEVIDPNAPAKRLSDPAKDDIRIAQRARQLLDSEDRWNRSDNRQCPPNAKTISLYCALEKATIEVTGGFEHRGDVMEDTRSAIDEVVPQHADWGHWLMGFNNDPSTTFGQLQQVLRVTQTRAAKHLEPKPSNTK